MRVSKLPFKKYINLGLLIIIIFLIYNFFFVTYSDDINNYYEQRLSYQYSEYTFPQLTDLPHYDMFVYEYKMNKLFSSGAILLHLTYDTEVYNTEKQKLQDSVVFLDDHDLDTVATGISEVEFNINSYHFRVLSGMDYPSSFGLIAISDQQRSISYLYINDLELDEISSMTKFVKKKFKYSFD